MLPPRTSFNASWFIDGNLVPWVESFLPAGWSAGRRKPVVHIDNAPTHISRMTHNFFAHNPLKKLPHPPHSFDISPSDFSLFGKVENTLIGREVHDDIDLFEALTEILNGASDTEL
jgi:hypothetical protein